jgi:hypothetical protein
MRRLLLVALLGGLAVAVTAPSALAQCTITCPANITISNDPNQCGAVVTYPAPTTTGACGVVVCSPASGSFFPVGTTTQTCTTTAGPSCSFTITVVDTQPPSITCPANILLTLPPGQSSGVVSYSAPTAVDNCPGLTAVSTPPSGSTLPLGTAVVTSTATDAAGNTATCTFTITLAASLGLVPTLSPAALAILGLVLAAVGAFVIRRLF